VIKNFIAQDKLFLRNDSIINCKISSILVDNISYRINDKVGLNFIPKSKVILVEYQSGEIFIFSLGADYQAKDSLLHSENTAERKVRKLKEFKQKEGGYANYLIGFYPTQLLFGRFTLSYEHLFANKTIGINVPISLTFNPGNAFRFLSTGSSSQSSSASSSTTTPDPPSNGIGFIGGLDVNYYYDIKAETKYYFGPRIRYGTDILLGSIEGLTFQIQNGFMLTSGKNFATNIGIGVGFFKLSEKYINYPGYSPKQVYPWASFTWRISFRS
jgi:hypothetical protein